MKPKHRRRVYHGTPTTYASVVFRSQLEASWARCFSRLGVVWVYEAVRVRIGPEQNYTPDFALPAYRALIEVKPKEPIEDELDRAARAATILGGGLYFLCGPPRAANFYAARNMGEGWYFVPVVGEDLPFPTRAPRGDPGEVVSSEDPCTPVESVMSFTMTAKKSGGGGDYEKAPPGNHPAVLVAVVDMGHQYQEPFKNDPKSKGGWQHRAYFVWELVTKKQSGSNRNHVIGLDLTLSLNEKAKLRKWIEARLGRPIREGENYDVTAELGQPCLLNVVEKNGYPKIEGVSAVPEGLPVPAAGNKPFAWKIETAEKSGRIDLPSWLPWHYGHPVGDAIKKSQEMEGRECVVVNSPNEPPTADQPAPVAAGNASPPPPPRRNTSPAEPSFFVDAGDETIPHTELYPVSKIKALVEAHTAVKWTEACVCRPGSQDWTPIASAIPEFATWQFVPF